ncbi:unnamed protein product [Orchesella dallaii]|uniref:Uncharacterized protein n=1 Tax=Orchesella dallaii TaxID=48710 RepID=A0ABP1QU02_9HEXA
MPVASSVRNQMMRLFRKGNKKGKGLVNNDASGSTSINTANSCYSELSEDNSSQIFKRSKSRRGSKLFRSIRKRFSRSKSYLQAAVTPNASKLGDSEADYQESETERFGSKGDSSTSGEVLNKGAERIRRRYSKRENRKSCPPPMRQILDEEDNQFSGGDSECGDGKAPLLLVPGGSVSQGPSSGVLSSCSYGDMKKDISPVVVVVEPPAEYCDPGTIGSSSDQGKSSLVDSKIKEPGSGGGTTTPAGGGGGGEPSSASSSRRPSVEMSGGAPRAELSVHGPNSSNTRGQSGGGGSGRKNDGGANSSVTDGASQSKKSDGPGRPPSGSSASSGGRQVERNFGNVRRGGGRKVRIIL